MSLVTARNLSHVSLFVRDLDASIAFYQRVFGYSVWHRGEAPTPDRTPNAFGLIGGVAIELLQLDENGPTRGREKVGISFAVDDIEAALTALRTAGLTDWRAPIAALGARLVIFEDPDGHFLEVIQHAPGRASLAELGHEVLGLSGE